MSRMKHDLNFQIYNITLSSCAVSLSIVLLFFFEFQITIFSQIYFILVDKGTCLMVIIVNEEKGLLASGVVEDFIFMPVCFDLD